MDVPVYDRLFRHAFSRPDTARDLALNLLPASYRRVVANARLSLAGESFIEQDLRGRFTELLVRFDMAETEPGETRGRGAKPASLYLYVLFEHKANPERWVPLQCLRYMVSLWSQERRDAEQEKEVSLKRLPEIVPLVLYHGTRGWHYPLAFQSLVSAPREARHVPRFEPLFVNLGDIPDEQLAGGVRAVVGLLFLKYLTRPVDRRVARTLLEAMHREPVGPELQAYYEPFYTAWLQVKEPEETEVMLAEAAAMRYHDTEEELMTHADQLRTEGRQEGLQEGRQEGEEEGRLREKREVLVRQLQRRFALSAQDRRRIEEAEDPERLDAALDAVVTAETKEAVLAELDK